MKSKQQVLELVSRTRVVAIVRTHDSASLVDVCSALCDGGISVIEITMTVPGALEVIRQAAGELVERDVCLGAGTVLDPKAAQAAVDAGARFIVAPTFNRKTVEFCNQQDVPVIPGAFTPSEIENAWNAGADIVKVFPANIGGPQYFKDLKGPLPEPRLMPTGNVNLESAPQYLENGAIAVGVGGVLFGKDLIPRRDFAQITKNARQLVSAVASS